jgi:hypothetical protein
MDEHFGTHRVGRLDVVGLARVGVRATRKPLHLDGQGPSVLPGHDVDAWLAAGGVGDAVNAPAVAGEMGCQPGLDPRLAVIGFPAPGDRRGRTADVFLADRAGYHRGGH